MQYPSSISAGRGQFGNRISSGGLTGGSFDPLIGRTVRTRWPDDNNFYEAVIADYSPAEVYLTFSDLVCFLFTHLMLL